MKNIILHRGSYSKTILLINEIIKHTRMELLLGEVNI